MTAPPDDTTTDLHAAIAALRAERDAGLAREAALAKELAARDATLAQRNTEYSERIEHQAATIDVLKVMSASPDDAQPVFDLIATRARDLCDAYGVTVFEFDGTLIHWRAATGVSDDPTARGAAQPLFPMAPTREWGVGRAILERRPIRIDDLETEPELSPALRAGTAKSSVVIPVMRNGVAIGALGLHNRERGGFSDSQVELLQTFAEQAVIAITSAETYRALQTRTSDLQQSLEYQTATSDMLNVISRSTFDLQPVLDTVVETAARLCVADQVILNRREGDLWPLVANFGFPPEYEAHVRSLGGTRFRPDMPSVAARTVWEKVPVHIHDVAAVPGYPDASIRLGKQRTSLGVPLLREGEVIGQIVLARQRVEPFTDRQIELVSNFADQAVIAMENARLITEQREALEQQTATAEVLQVINANPGDLAPVFDAMLDRAMRLCDGAQGTLWMFDGERMCASATAGYSSELAEQLSEWREIHPFQRRLLQGERVFQVNDLAAEELYHSGNPLTRAAVDVAAIRTVVFVALVKDAATLGGFTIGRREIRAFTDKHIALLQNFAEQAVIAIENARLITEQREALEQQTATAEVLQVINASPGNLAPVFDAILEKAMRLCDAAFGSLYTYDGEGFHSAAHLGVPKAYEEWRATVPPSPRTTVPARILKEKRSIHVIDLMQEEDYAAGDVVLHKMHELGGIRTALSVPLLKDDVVLGFVTIFRQEVQAFSNKQIALLESFAAQAVIAMENARLLTEQREALEQQTATAEVLQVINANPSNLAPVFDAMLERAMRLCGIAFGMMTTFDGERFLPVCWRGLPTTLSKYFAEGGGPSGSSGMHAQLLGGAPLAYVADMKDEEAYRSGYPARRALVDLGGARTGLAIALRKEGVLLGSFMLYRQEVRAFSDKEIALLQSFAAQAVIAMENARLLTEQREALEHQTATAEVLGVINASPANFNRFSTPWSGVRCGCATPRWVNSPCLRARI